MPEACKWVVLDIRVPFLGPQHSTAPFLIRTLKGTFTQVQASLPSVPVVGMTVKVAEVFTRAGSLDLAVLAQHRARLLPGLSS